MRTAQMVEEKKSLKAKTSKLRKTRKDKGQKARNYNPKSRANLRMYEKGVSGNPGGLPGTDMAAKIARAALETCGAEIAFGMAKQMRNGNAYAFSVMADRAYGKVKQGHEISGPDGAPIAMTVKIVKPTLKDLK